MDEDMMIPYGMAAFSSVICRILSAIEKPLRSISFPKDFKTSDLSL